MVYLYGMDAGTCLASKSGVVTVLGGGGLTLCITEGREGAEEAICTLLE
jgi:hypothetical protein